MLGHSFTRRFDNLIRQGLQNSPLQHDVDAGVEMMGHMAAQALRIAQNFGQLNFRFSAYAQNYSLSDDFGDEMLALVVLSPDVLVICLGSNALMQA